MSQDTTVSAIKNMSDTYGPYAFGTVCLLVVWFIIVQPELESRRIDYEAQNAILNRLAERDTQAMVIADALEKASSSNAVASEANRATAVILERAVNRLDRWEASRHFPSELGEQESTN